MITAAAAIVVVAVGTGSATPPRDRASEDAAGTVASRKRTPPQRLDWNPRWRRFDVVEYLATAVVGGAWAYVEFGVDRPNDPNWTGSGAFDEGIRDAMVGSSRERRDRSGTASDFTSLLPAALSFVDAAAVPLLGGGDFDLAWQMTAMNLQAFAATGLLSRLGHRVVARERPDVAECERNPDYGAGCFKGTLASFPSGHASTAFAGAGLVCAHHAFVPLYGHPIADWTACGVNASLAMTTGLLRIVADRHYATDVLTGAALGAGFGAGLPLLLHYGFDAGSPAGGGAATTIVPIVTGTTRGVAIRGRL